MTDLIFLALLVSLSFSVLSQRLLGDADTGWHIRDGQQIISTHTLPRTDSFSSTMNGKRWYAWEWLYDATVGLIYNGAGLNGVVFFSAILIALTFALLFGFCLNRGTGVAVAVLVVLLSASASTIHFLARPHLVSWIFSLAWLHLLDSSETDAARATHPFLYSLPLLMLLWVNLHGGFLMGFVLLGIYLIAAVFERFSSSDLNTKTAADNRMRALAFTSILCLLASLVNPYGYKLHAHVYAYLSNSFLMNHIDEFQSPNFHGVAQRCFLVLLLFAVFTLSVSPRRATASQLLLVLFGACSGLYASRNIPIASILVSFAIAPLFSAWTTSVSNSARSSAVLQRLASRLDSFSARMSRVDSQQRGHLWPLVLVLFGCWVCAHQGYFGARALMNAHFDEKRFPVRAADFLQSRHIVEPIFSPDSWGGYLIYRLYPQVKVVTDDRHDLYGEQFLKQYLKVIHVEPEWESILDAWKIQVVLLPAKSALSSTLKQTSHWSILHDDGTAIVFQRTDRERLIADQPSKTDNQ